METDDRSDNVHVCCEDNVLYKHIYCRKGIHLVLSCVSISYDCCIVVTIELEVCLSYNDTIPMCQLSCCTSNFLFHVGDS